MDLYLHIAYNQSQVISIYYGDNSQELATKEAIKRNIHCIKFKTNIENCYDLNCNCIYSCDLFEEDPYWKNENYLLLTNEHETDDNKLQLYINQYNYQFSSENYYYVKKFPIYLSKK